MNRDWRPARNAEIREFPRNQVLSNEAPSSNSETGHVAPVYPLLSGERPRDCPGYEGSQKPESSASR